MCYILLKRNELEPSDLNNLIKSTCNTYNVNQCARREQIVLQEMDHD